MAIDTINIGTTANDGSGDPLRTAFTKINTMFTELYGTSGEGVAMKDDETPQLGGDLDVLGRRITSTRSNEDIVILPNGTGGVVASGIRLAGTQLSADDSSAITIAEALQINGATNIDGAVTATSTLTVTGATTVAAISASGAATFTGGVTAGAVTTNVITSNGSNADLSIQPSGTGDVVISALRVNGTTLDSSDSTKVTIAEAVDITGAVTAASTVGITGAATLSSTLAVTGATTLTTTNIDNINIYDNYITSDSNADINITAGGTGNVIVGSLTVNGTAISSADSSLIQLNEAVNISGATDIAGALTTIGQTITGNVSITGATTFVGAIAVGDLNILADGTITTDSNGDFVVDPAGTGAIVLTGPITATGVQTTTGQLNVDNLRFDGNTFSATSGGITLTPADGQNVVVSGTNVNLVAGEANFTVCEATTLRTDTLQNDTSDGDLTISTQGTGVVTTASQVTLTGSFKQAIHTFVATDAITEAEHAGRTCLLGVTGGAALVTLTLPDATGSGATYKLIATVVNSSSYVIKVPDANNTIDGIMLYLDEDGTAVTAFPTVAASDTITLNGGTTGGQIGDYLELVDIATDQWHVRGVMRCLAGVNPGTCFSATVS